MPQQKIAAAVAAQITTALSQPHEVPVIHRDLKPSNIDRYELLEELGHGGMGSVWRGYDSVLDRPVAVKLIRQEAVTSPRLAEEFAKRFQREARVTARIQHPGVPQVYDAGLDDSHDRVFLVMELVDGVPLSGCVRPGAPLPVGW